MVGQICVPEVAPTDHLANRFSRGYLPLGRGALWTPKGLLSAGAESSPWIPLGWAPIFFAEQPVVACLRYLQRKVKQQRPPRAGPSPPFIRRVETALFFLFLGAQPLSHLSAHFLLAWGPGTGPAHLQLALSRPSTGAVGTLMYWGAGADWTSRVLHALSAWRCSSGCWSPAVTPGEGSRRHSPRAGSIGPAVCLLGARGRGPRISAAILPLGWG